MKTQTKRFHLPGTLAVAIVLLACSSLPATAGKLPVGFTEHFADVNGVKLHYFIGGKGGAVVLLHGYDMRPEDLEPFSRSLNVPALFHFPRGPLSTPSGNRCWWPIDQERRSRQLEAGPRDLFEEAPPGRPAARDRLCVYLDELRASSPKLPLLLGGFSQGGMLACDTVLCARQPVSASI